MNQVDFKHCVRVCDGPLRTAAGHMFDRKVEPRLDTCLNRGWTHVCPPKARASMKIHLVFSGLLILLSIPIHNVVPKEISSTSQ